MANYRYLLDTNCISSLFRAPQGNVYQHLQRVGDDDVLPLDALADQAYAEIRAYLEGTGQIIGPNDLLIAAHALSLGLVAVTDNVGEFERVPGLVVENWLLP